MEHESGGGANCNWFARYTYQKTGKRTGRIGNKMTSGDYPNFSIVKIGQNTEKSPEDLRRLALTQTPAENHQVTLV